LSSITINEEMFFKAFKLKGDVTLEDSWEDLKKQAHAAQKAFQSLDDAFDKIYDVIGDLLLEGKYEHVDALLWSVLHPSSSEIALLTATLPAKNKLGVRRSVYLHALSKYTYENRPEVLKGLE